MEEYYRIHFVSYYPDNETKGKKKGEMIVSVVLFTRKSTLDEAKTEARALWKKWMEKYSGSMAEIWLHSTDGPAKVGPRDAIMYASNIEKFKPGILGERDPNVPF